MACMDPVIILMTRIPQPGTAKTRLIPLLGGEGAAQLQQAMCRDIGALLASCEYPKHIFYTDGKDDDLPGLLGHAFPAAEQKGEDLGARMAHAFTTVFAQDYDKAVMLGSDLPHLPIKYIHQAIQQLKTHDAVIGPSPDGGYYLIGFNQGIFNVDFFAGQQWGTQTVLEGTMQRFDENDLSVFLLPELQDIDTPDHLIEADTINPTTAPHTAVFIKQFFQSMD